MSELIEPYAIKIGGKTGTAPYRVRAERRLSGLREHFLGRNLVEDMLSRGENPVIYEVHEIPQKPIDRSLSVGYMHASLFTDEAVELLSRGQGSRAVVLQNGEITSIGLEESCKTEKTIDLGILDLARVLVT